MSAAVRSRAVGAAAAAAVQSVYVFSRRKHAGRTSDVHKNNRRRRRDRDGDRDGDRDRDRDGDRDQDRDQDRDSLWGRVDWGALVPSTPLPETADQSSGERPGVSGVTVDSASLGGINVMRVGGGGGGGGGSGAGGGGGRFGSENAYWVGPSLPIPKEICRGLDKFVVGQERAKKVNFGAFDRITGFVGRVHL